MLVNEMAKCETNAELCTNVHDLNANKLVHERVERAVLNEAHEHQEASVHDELVVLCEHEVQHIGNAQHLLDEMCVQRELQNNVAQHENTYA